MKRFALVFFCLTALLSVSFFASDAYAYQRYNSGCQSCHGAFTDSTSPRGTVFPSSSKHEMHRASTAMATNCSLCHTSGDNRDPYLGSSDGTASNTGLGCTGCHNAAGLRAHHAANGVTVCAGCHGTGTASAENVKPPYYGTIDTKANNSCNAVAQSNINENWSIGDFKGLDNDGDNLYDASDPNCQSVPAGAMSVSPAGGLSSSGAQGGSFSPASTSYTLTNTGGTSINWTAAKTQSWVTLSTASGTLAAGATATVAVSINSGANALAAGSYSDTVTFTNTTNGTGNTTRAVSLTVTALAAPTISTTSPLPTGTVGTAYSQTFAATGGTTPYSWSASTGLPTGVTFSSSWVR